MGTRVYAFLEVFVKNRWLYTGDFIHDEEYDFALVPKNIAPESWGAFNFAVYYEASKEKGFPSDMSAALLNFVDTYWEWANRPSWMTVAEMRAFYEADKDGRFAHIDFETISSRFKLPEAHIKVVLWADQ
jgi:hypothetical protein